MRNNGSAAGAPLRRRHIPLMPPATSSVAWREPVLRNSPAQSGFLREIWRMGVESAMRSLARANEEARRLHLAERTCSRA